jgi:tricorn protease
MKDREERILQLTKMRGDKGHPRPAPKGDHLLFFSNAMGAYQLWIATFKDGRISGEKPLTTALRFSDIWSDHGLRWAADAKSAYLLDKGQIVKIEIPSGKLTRLSLKTSITERPQEAFLRDFRTVWRTMRDEFYDPTMSKQDWPALYQYYLPAIRAVETRQDFIDLMNEMLGHLNASHLGVRDLKPLPHAYKTGGLGARITWDGKGFRLTDILPLSPLAKLPKPPKEGTYLIAIDGRPLEENQNPFALLRNRIGKRLRLTLNEKPEKQGAHQISIHPIPYSQENQLRYRAWVAERRQRTHALSQGKIGYLHMQAMTQPNLLQFIRDLETELAHRKAAIIDLRFNWGGNVHDRVLSLLERRLYGRWQIRDGKPWRQPFFAIAHKPMVMLINEETLSDGEMTANGFRALRLGKIIGMPTYRWLIFTSGAILPNQMMFRIPFWACTTLDGKDLEKTGVEPHILIEETLQDRLRNHDPQLKRAIQELQRQIPAPSISPTPSK